MHLTTAKLPLHPKNVAAIHRTGFRIDPADYISIIFNPYSFQVKLGIGENLRQYIDGDLESEIVYMMQTKLDDGEIIAGIESGIIKVNQYLPKNLKRKT